MTRTGILKRMVFFSLITAVGVWGIASSAGRDGDLDPRPDTEMKDGGLLLENRVARQTLSDSTRISVLVHFAQFDSGDIRAQDARRRLLQFADNVDGYIRHEYEHVLPNVINLRDVPELRLAELERMPGVVKVERDYLVHASLHDSVPLVRALPGQLAGAGVSADGSGTRICILDTGIRSDHVMYSSRIDFAASFDFVNNDPNAEDDQGHGSHVAGIAAGGTGLTVDFGCEGAQPFQGMAPNATLIGGKVLNSSGSGFASDIIAGINHCASPTLVGGQADVINMSLGGGGFSGNCDGDSLANASNNAVAAGTVVVSSSGNDGFSNAMGTPACASQVIAVGSVYDDPFPNCENPTQNGFTWCLNSFCTSTCTDSGPDQDDIVCSSNKSTTIDVAAPGCITYSANDGGGTTSIVGLCGTSMASPHVAGLVALILDRDPNLTPAQVRQAIRNGAIDMGSPGFDNSYGHGRIDAINTLQLVGGGGCSGDGECDDGLFCNGAETCDGTCQPGTPPNCNDGVGCTDDSCNEGTDSCENLPEDANCDNGAFCDGAETCSATLDCQAGTDSCPGTTCNETTDTCGCVVDADCDDGAFCNGAEVCNAGTCEGGTAPNCNDNVSCTNDSCNEGTDTCDNIPVNGNCNDGQFCNGIEACDASDGCIAGTAPNCDDGVGCTDDSCNETTDSCDSSPDDGNCDDGAFCNGLETCDAVNDCQAGGGDPCVPLTCDEINDVCVCIGDGECDDGLFCNGAESCNAGACQAGPDPCGAGQTCNESTDVCESGPTPRLETGVVSVGAGPITVNLTNNYTSAVVVCSVQYNNNSVPVVTRVTNVTGSSFDVFLQSPSGDPVTADNVSYIVVEEGVWTIDGVKVEAQKYTSTVTDHDTSWLGQVRAYGQTYANPVVLGQVMSVVDADWSVFWSRGTTNARPPSTTTLLTGKTVCEDPDTSRANETIGVIVFEAGHGTIGGVEFEAALGPDTVQGVTNSPPYSYTFSSAFASPPQVTVTIQSAMDGGNGGWAQTHGPTAATNTTLFLSIDEDQILDTERAHTHEQVGYAAFETPVVFPVSAGCTVDADCDDGQFCNGAETCNAGSCQAGTAPNCSDGVSCTVDTCNEGADSCDNVADDSLCGDGAFCNGVETCDEVLDCQPGGSPCPGLCDEATNACVECLIDGDCTDDGSFCNGDEVCNAGVCESAGSPCAGGQTCNESIDQCEGGAAGILETGTVPAGGTAVTVDLSSNYASPVVVCSVQFDNNSTPVVARVTNVTASSFDVFLQSPSGAPVTTDSISYIVVEEGVHTINGVDIEARTYDSILTDENDSWIGEAQTDGLGFTNPVVIGQVMSTNDPDWSVFWSRGTTKNRPPTSTTLFTGKTVCEDTDVTRAVETVGYIVFEAGHGSIGGVEFEAALGSDSIQGIGNAPPYGYAFNTVFSSAPQVTVTTLSAMDGGDGGWAQTHGATAATTSTLFLSIDEDLIGDGERAHTHEQVAYVVFEVPVTVNQ